MLEVYEPAHVDGGINPLPLFDLVDAAFATGKRPPAREAGAYGRRICSCVRGARHNPRWREPHGNRSWVARFRSLVSHDELVTRRVT